MSTKLSYGLIYKSCSMLNIIEQEIECLNIKKVIASKVSDFVFSDALCHFCAETCLCS